MLIIHLYSFYSTVTILYCSKYYKVTKANPVNKCHDVGDMNAIQQNHIFYQDKKE